MTSVVHRRAFLGAMAGGLLAAPVIVEAQQPTKYLIGFLGAESLSTNQHFLDAFRQGLREHGYVDGQNLTLEERWAEGRSELFPGLIGGLARVESPGIFTGTPPAHLRAGGAHPQAPPAFLPGGPPRAGPT